MSNETKLSDFAQAMFDVLAGDIRESPKQVLVTMYQKGHLGRTQLRACADRLDELLEEHAGEENVAILALGTLAQEFDAGQVQLASGKAATMQHRPTIFEAPADEGAKQCVVFLLEKGTLGKVEAQQVARVINEADPPVEGRAGVARILYVLGYRHALTTEFVEEMDRELGAVARTIPAAVPQDAPPADLPPTPPASEPAPLPSPEQIAEFLAPPVAAIVPQVKKIDRIDVLNAIENAERSRTDKEPRSTLLTAIAERVGVLMLDDDNQPPAEP